MEQETLTNERKKELKQLAKAKSELEEKQKKLQDVIKDDIDTSEKLTSLFNKIEFLSLTNEQKEKVSIDIKENSKIDKLYIIELVLSLLIVTLGLLQNSVAVVVGAMLIAPIMRPINGLAYSIARGGQVIFKKSIWMLFVSICVSVFLSYITTKIVGFQLETSEIFARTNPNLIDFFIAVFSGMIGVMSIRFSRLGSGLSGVAMAVALLPPLSVVGIELAFGSYNSAFGAFLLFLTNILAIGLISTIFFWLYGFTPHNKNLQSKVLRRLLVFLFTIFLVLIPLSFSYTSMININQTSTKIEKYMSSFLYSKVEFFEISKVQIVRESFNDIQVQVLLKVPYNTDLEEILGKLKGYLKNEFSKDVDLEVEVIRVLKL